MKTAVKILKYTLAALGVFLVVLHFIPNTGYNKIWSYLATILLPFVIDIARLLGVKVSKEFEMCYLIFLIPAMILGIDFDLYKVFYPLDKIAHGFSGVLSAFGAKEILDQASGRPDEKWFKVLFIIAFVGFVAMLWECFEFACDQIGGTSMQQLIAPGISDTMYDMIVAMVGGIVGTIFIFVRKTR